MTECEFTHIIKDYSKIVNKKCYSDVLEFEGGKYKWQLLFFPRGNQVDDLSVYFVVPEPSKLPQGWCWVCELYLTLVNKDPKKSITQDATFTFRQQNNDRGFNQVSKRKLKEIINPKNGFLVKDCFTLQCKIRVLEDKIDNSTSDEEDIDPNRFHHFDSKKESGFVGLRNQGATCYLNSLMQAFFILTKFRRSVYQLPIDPEAKPISNIPLALQRLFLLLQTTSSPVSTYELTQSFGWTQDDAATQQDIQEFSRVLQDNLETKMKGTPEEGTIEQLFRGETYNYIRCTKVDFKSERREYYYGTPHTFVRRWHWKYCEVEVLDKDNLYNAGPKLGMQQAKKGILFNSFPPVLLLHLKRFDFDMVRQEHRKINDRHVFPPVLQLNEFLSPEADKTIDYKYHLHGVLVHSGGVHGGHYYAFLKPTPGPQWFKFDDSVVHKVSSYRAIDDNFGGVEMTFMSSSTSKKSSNAYMLLYILDKNRASLLKPLEPTDIPAHITQRFEDEKAEVERIQKAKAEELLYMNIRLVTEEDMKRYNGYDLVDMSKCKSLRVKKEQTLGETIPSISELLNIPACEFRIWDWRRRTNGSIRPDQPYGANVLKSTIKALHTPKDENLGREFSVFIDLARIPSDGSSTHSLNHTEEVDSVRFVETREQKNRLVLFIKFYNPEKERLNFIGKVECGSQDRLFDLLTPINSLLNRNTDLPLLFFEEVSSEMVCDLSPGQTMDDAELGTGDIVTVQIPLTTTDYTTWRFPLASDYYTYLVGRMSITVKHYDNPTEPGFILELQKEMKFNEWTAAIAKHLNWNPNQIRFTAGQSPTSPSMIPISKTRADNQTLESVVYTNATIFYELFHIDVSHLYNYRIFKIMWRDNHTTPMGKVTVCVKNSSSYSSINQDVILELKALGSISASASVVKFSTSGEIRLFQVLNHKIEREYLPGQNHTVPESLNYQIEAEEIPLEEVELHPKDQKVWVGHYIYIDNRLEPILNPFISILKHNETAAELKLRIINRLGWPQDKAKVIKICRVANNQAHYFKDDEQPIAANWGASGTYLGIEHTLSNTKTKSKEKSVQIYG